MLHDNISKTNHKFIVSLLVGSTLLAIGINIFIAPHNLAFGGVTGMTIIIHSLFGLPISVSNLILSTIVICVGWLELGNKFMVKTIIPTVLLSPLLFLTASSLRFTASLPISAVLGAVTVGIGISLIMFAGGSTAGPDTIGLVLKKRFNIPITLTMLTIDILVILCGYRIYGIRTAAWSVGVAVIMNITIKLVRNILSKKVIFRYWNKSTNKHTAAPKSLNT